jgi:hypothetical protein
MAEEISLGISNKTFIAGLIIAILASSMLSTAVATQWAVIQGPKGEKETQDHKASKAKPVPKDHKVSKDHRGSKDHMDLKESKDRQVNQVLGLNQVFWLRQHLTVVG